jgi:hypothetical protein
MVDEIKIMRVIEDGRARYFAEMIQEFGEIPGAVAGQRN